MTIAARWLSRLFTAFAVACSALTMMGSEAAAQKDDPPSGSRCDRYKKNSAAWKKCVGTASNSLSDQELFYAGYWLARTGKYQDALGYLTRARTQDAKILTYIGFATRKLGDHDTAMSYYTRALEINPDFSVARAYLGEAYLERGDVVRARDQLAEIEKRSGAASAEYAELETLIEMYGADHKS
jgi:tetratricopeptide (TPR) repeat protein